LLSGHNTTWILILSYPFWHFLLDCSTFLPIILEWPLVCFLVRPSNFWFLNLWTLFFLVDLYTYLYFLCLILANSTSNFAPSPLIILIMLHFIFLLFQTFAGVFIGCWLIKVVCLILSVRLALWQLLIFGCCFGFNLTPSLFVTYKANDCLLTNG
jgi:hypothetical protein